MTPAPSKKLPWRYAVAPGLFLLLVFWLSAYQANIEVLFRDSSVHLLRASAQHVHRGFAVAFWLGWAWFINGLVALFVWEGVARHLVTGSVPRFFRNTVSILIFMVAIAGILSLVFGLDLTGLWATSGVLGLVLGFALKSLIADFFSGVALSLDPPFKIGDWIQVTLPGEGTLYGQVVEMHWRQTKIQSRGRTRTVSVPHSLLTSASVHQLYQPAGRLRFDWSISLNQTLGVDRSIRILEAAVYSAPMILQDPRPQVLMTGNDSSGLTYNIRYWIKPDISMEKARHAVVHSVFTTMERANVLLACIKIDVFNAAQVPDVWDPEGGKSTFIALTSVFSTLEEEEVQELASRTTIREVQAGETVVAAGQPGDSMYIIREGTLDVLLHADGEHSKVAHLRSGDFFGEMSLLTGEPRSATVNAVSHAVLYEIDKEALQPVLTRNPHIAERICEVVALRQSKNVDHLDTRAAAAAAGGGGGFGTQLLAKVRKFFAL